MSAPQPTTNRIAEGLLLVDKPAGLTSHDVVSVARRALRERRIGHAGTLDPFATGLLVLLVGRATRLLPFLDGEPKVYDAVIAFGAETTTDDLTGDVTRRAPLPAPDAVRHGIATLTGSIAQIPPAFSAKKVDGTRAYAHARRGQPVELSASTVIVHEWIVANASEDRLTTRIVCSGGTYVRALARDLGRLAESAAHLVSLRRVRSGPFDVADAVTIDTLQEGTAELRPARAAVPSLSARTMTGDELRRTANHAR
jgi:tRNA pseudouridine55 synthase